MTRAGSSRLTLRHGLLVAILIAAIAIGLTLWVGDWRELAVYSLSERRDQRMAKYTFEGLSYTVMSEQGVPRYRIDARTMTRYSNDENTEFIDPLFWLYRPQEAPLEVRADWAQMSPKKDRLILKGNVVVDQPQTQERRAYTLKTSEALVLPEQEIATTDRPLTLYGVNFDVESIGGRINLRNRHVHFFKQVKGLYEP